MTVGWIVEREWQFATGAHGYLVRVDGGRHLQVVIPAALVRGDEASAIIDEAVRLLPPPLGPNTRAGVDE